MRRFVVFSSVVVTVLAGCALRPRYAEVVQRSEVQQGSEELVFRLIEPKSQLPISGAGVEIQEGGQTLRATSDAAGVVRMPHQERWVLANPLVEVVLPGNTASYVIVPAPPSTSVQSEPVSSPAVPEPAPAPTPVETRPTIPVVPPAPAAEQAPGVEPVPSTITPEASGAPDSTDAGS